MRITLAELATFRVAVKFRPADTATIIVYDITNAATPVLASAICTQIGATGVFYWSFSNLNAQPGAATIYLWTMTSSTSGDYTGPMIYAGSWPDDISTRVNEVINKLITGSLPPNPVKWGI